LIVIKQKKMCTAKEAYSGIEIQPNYGVESNHLGNVLVTVSARPRLMYDLTTYTHKEADVTSVSDYYPFGMLKPSRHWQSDSYKFGFNGWEKDDEIKGVGNHITWGDYGYDPRIARRWCPDPMQFKFPSISSYAALNNSPLIFVDKDGEEVYAVFDKSTETLYIIDLDHYQTDLPFKKVNASDYQLGGIRDNQGKLTHNQVLVINNVFSGGRAVDGVVSYGTTSREIPIPSDTWDILEHGKSGWYRLDAQDKSPYNNVYDVEGVVNSEGRLRTGFAWHTGSVSHGCVTVDESATSRDKEWGLVEQILNTTSTSSVPNRVGRQKYNPFSSQVKYGTMKTIGEQPTDSSRSSIDNDDNYPGEGLPPP